MKPLASGSELRKCKDCGKTYVLELGFYKNGKGGYSYNCKGCDKAINTNRTHEKKDYTFENHFYDKEDANLISECKRCGCFMKRIAFSNRPGKWLYRWKNESEEWKNVNPQCVTKEENRKTKV